MPRTISKTEVRQNVANPNMSYGDPDPSIEASRIATDPHRFDKDQEELLKAAEQALVKLSWESRDRDRDGNYWSFACEPLGLLITLNRTLQSLNSDGKNPAGRSRQDAEWILLAFGKVIGRGALADLKENALQYLQNQT